jgi:2-iminobutanoate/2-iminopropanoate deaminase
MKKAVLSTGAPKAIGPYSQAVESAGFLYISGQLPINAETGVMPDTITAQAEQSLGNIAAILAEAAYGRGNIVKTTIFLKNLSDFEEVNRIYANFFAGCTFPARSTVEVAALPRGALVEIEAVAYREPS